MLDPILAPFQFRHWSSTCGTGTHTIPKWHARFFCVDAHLGIIMIKSMEIRYQYNMDKLPSYYKAKSQLATLQSMIVMLENDVSQRKYMLNTLMARDKKESLEIDSNYEIKDFNLFETDLSSYINNRSDIKAIDKTKDINKLKICLQIEKSWMMYNRIYQGTSKDLRAQLMPLSASYKSLTPSMKRQISG